ncbi:hypothetical protein BJ508DRAFT_345450, partial [Ascobolus immersus RN42]
SSPATPTNFPSRRALTQHLESSYSHKYCFECSRDFPSAHALDQHLEYSSEHRSLDYYCDDCDKWFDTQNSLDMHLERSPNHRVDEWECEECDLSFDSEYSLDMHLERSRAHQNWWCEKCRRSFDSERSLDQHIERSAAHIQDQYRPGTLIPRNNYDPHRIKCPGCTRLFATTSAMTVHLESSTCTSGITRQRLNAFVRGADTRGLITKNLLTSSETILETVATNASWNGRAFACYFCDREFRTLQALNQHLNSPAHEQMMYHCPKCKSEFRRLSGLVQHVESERFGLMRFADVRGHFQGSIRFDRMLGY